MRAPVGRAPLRVALLAPHRHPVAPPFAGGLEAMVWHLARALRAEGHQVTLFAPEGSDPGAADALVTSTPWQPSSAAARDVSMPSVEQVAGVRAHLGTMMRLTTDLAGAFDVVHNHALHPLPLAWAPHLPVPMLTTLHTPPTPWMELGVDVAATTPGTHRNPIHFAAVSAFTARSWQTLRPRPTVVHNGVDTRTWTPGPGGEALAWSGRFTPEKAPHLAIEAARAAGRPLRLAGPVSDPAYFAQEVRPRLGGDVEYVGHLDRAELADLLGSSAALLVTPLWDEPFALVVAEAMACGTPVAGFAAGGIPEVIGDALHGVLVERGDVAALTAAIPVAAGLDRGLVRAHAQAHLSLEAMTRRYVGLYHALLSAPRRPGLPDLPGGRAVPA